MAAKNRGGCPVSGTASFLSFKHPFYLPVLLSDFEALAGLLFEAAGAFTSEDLPVLPLTPVEERTGSVFIWLPPFPKSLLRSRVSTGVLARPVEMVDLRS